MRKFALTEVEEAGGTGYPDCFRCKDGSRF